MSINGEIPSEIMKRFLALYAEAWSEPASGKLGKLWKEDALMRHPEFTQAMRGRENILAYLRQVLDIAPDLRVRPLSAAAAGQQIFIQFEAQGTFGGSTLTWEGVDVFTLDGDQASYGIGYFDPSPIREAVTAAATA